MPIYTTGGTKLHKARVNWTIFPSSNTHAHSIHFMDFLYKILSMRALNSPLSCRINSECIHDRVSPQSAMFLGGPIYTDIPSIIHNELWIPIVDYELLRRVKVGNIAHMVWFAHFLFTDSAYIAHAFQCITISFYRTNVNVMSIHGVTNRPKMTTPSIVWWEGRLLFLEVVTHFWVHDPLFLWSKQLLFQFKIYVVACW